MLIADTAVIERSTAEQHAAIAMRSSAFAKRMGLDPRVAFVSYTISRKSAGNARRRAA